VNLATGSYSFERSIAASAAKLCACGETGTAFCAHHNRGRFHGDSRDAAEAAAFRRTQAAGRRRFELRLNDLLFRIGTNLDHTFVIVVTRIRDP